MALFDPKQQRMCVRIVYDGAASAGKTTNLRQLAEIFATQKKGELHSPAEMGGRTLFFDWLQIAAGVVNGFPLLCQVISVPGQVVLTPRRRHLLSTADAVVHVCDSEEQSASRAREGLVLFDELVHERQELIPLVVQANKQDRPGALTGAALVAALGRSQVPVVEAIASDGIGVVDTFVAAVRGVVRAIQARVERGEVRVAVRLAETAEAVLEDLAAEAVDPEWALELMLEEASNAFAIATALDGAPGEAVAAEARDSDPPPTWRPASSARQAIDVPTEHVPTGFIWPAHTGRARLRALAGEAGMQEPARLGDDGAVRLVIHDFVLSTSRSRRFDTLDAARQALVRAARERTQLGALLAPETVLVAQPGRDDSSWLWTVLPAMRAVVDLAELGDPGTPARNAVLAAFGGALAEALRAEALHGVALDLSARSYGLRQGVIRYTGEVRAADVPGRDIGAALVDSLVQLASVFDDIEPAITGLEAAIGSRLGPDERARIARDSRWRTTLPLPTVLSGIVPRLEDALNRGRRAA